MQKIRPKVKSRFGAQLLYDPHQPRTKASRRPISWTLHRPLVDIAENVKGRIRYPVTDPARMASVMLADYLGARRDPALCTVAMIRPER